MVPFPLLFSVFYCCCCIVVVVVVVVVVVNVFCFLFSVAVNEQVKITLLSHGNN